ncbi:splicing factor, arginine/serine-rich 19-like [Zingiber officinale]|uniref:Uncharacterized protein n=1 Tax=Zingiber officinale TaxID=94328 RepID=A0A8J5GMG7_ZINOF|nr:splicing factor, arginine/serine-rich 19-like [Zingiber officinale]KAG6503788.1 hypothetical protein ZIOFF_036112 [Zingiber officinale]
MEREDSSSSSEFEFWMVGSNPSPALLTADELFVDGVLLPLQKLSMVSNPGRSGTPAPPPAPPTAASSSSPPPAATTHPRPKKWPPKKERRGGSSGGPAELNINLWPFPRSRSAGVARFSSSSASPATRRKVRSAPCSRSNSRGESSKAAATTKWAPVSSRVVAAAFVGGIHLGRTNPVWKIQKKIVNNNQQQSPPADSNAESGKAKKSGGGGGGVRALNFQVNTCIGWRNNRDRNRAAAAGGGGFFKLPAMFSFPRTSTPPTN